MIEARLIRRLNPEMNIRKFARELMAAQAEDAVDTSDFFQRPRRQVPIIRVERPKGYHLFQCLCGRTVALSYEQPKQVCECGATIEMNVPMEA
jgi:hypothetical protein